MLVSWFIRICNKVGFSDLLCSMWGASQCRKAEEKADLIPMWERATQLENGSITPTQ